MHKSGNEVMLHMDNDEAKDDESVYKTSQMYIQQNSFLVFSLTLFYSTSSVINVGYELFNALFASARGIGLVCELIDQG